MHWLAYDYSVRVRLGGDDELNQLILQARHGYVVIKSGVKVFQNGSSTNQHAVPSTC